MRMGTQHVPQPYQHTPPVRLAMLVTVLVIVAMTVAMAVGAAVRLAHAR